MYRICLLLLVFAVSGASSAEACSRCGLFGNRCRYQQYYYPQQVAVAPVVQYKQPDVFVVQNNYPQPNGAVGLLAQQGASVYGYQAAAAPYAFVNPAETLRQATELSKAALSTASLGLTSHNQIAQTQLTLQASIAEPLVRGQAAAQILGAAGLSAPVSQPQSLALRITQGANGQWQVTQADPIQVNAQVRAEITGGPIPNQPGGPPQGDPPGQLPPPAPTSSVLARKCASCHGLALTEPKGNVFIDAGHRLDCKTAWTALKLVKAGKMPPDSALTDQEKGLLLDELEGLVTLEREGGT